MHGRWVGVGSGGRGLACVVIVACRLASGGTVGGSFVCVCWWWWLCVRLAWVSVCVWRGGGRAGLARTLNEPPAGWGGVLTSFSGESPGGGGGTYKRTCAPAGNRGVDLQDRANMVNPRYKRSSVLPRWKKGGVLSDCNNGILSFRRKMGGGSLAKGGSLATPTARML